MFDTAPRPLTRVDAAVDEVLALTHTPDAWGSATPAELMSTLERLQQAANLVAAAEQSLLAHAITCDTFEQYGATSTVDLLVNRCHIRRSEAHTRVRRAAKAAPRTTLTGEPLPPKFEQLTDAQAAGAVTADHVDVVTHWLTKIEPHAGLQQFTDIETELVTLSTATTPDAVAARGREILDTLDPDGPAPRDLERRRALSFRQDDDGAGRLTGTLTPEVLAKLQTALSPLAAPRPENPETGEKDRRGVGQRQHDALEELLTRLLMSDGMPNHGGIPLTLIVMMDLDDLIARTGTARTAFGTTIPVQRLLEQAAELQVVPVITSTADGILAYGVNRRIASPGQALALIGRDRGCTFPGCHRPAQWCQRHHIREVVADNGETDLDNLVLVCPHHHRHFSRWGWTVHLEHGRAWWTPPATVDPDRQPQLNHTHHPTDLSAEPLTDAL